MESKKSNTPVYIKEITLANYRSFKGEHTFTFVDEKDKWCRWTVFLGNNNSGKTNLLKLTAMIDPKESKLLYYYWTVPELVNVKVALKDTENNIYSYKAPFRTYGEPSSPWSWEDDLLKFYAYGVIRKIDTTGISESKATANTDNLLSNSTLINFEDWLFQLDYAAKNGQEKAAAQRELLKKVLVGEIFPEINDIRFVSDEKLNNYIQYQTKDGGWYRLSELGYGYQAMLAWLMDFAKRLFDRYPDSPNPLKEPAVLLVDEIDLHLHPYWQRTIIKYLSELFTQTQFIVTTHSPFILQSMENVNLYTLRREGDHTISSHLGNRSFIGWGIEEILSEIMELEDDIRTDRYQDLLKRFNEALDNDNYSAAKEAYGELSKILHPESVERKLMEIQMTKLSPSDD
jgi:predicted ATP-binding protein involved in virulence